MLDSRVSRNVSASFNEIYDSLLGNLPIVRECFDDADAATMGTPVGGTNKLACALACSSYIIRTLGDPSKLQEFMVDLGNPDCENVWISRGQAALENPKKALNLDYFSSKDHENENLYTTCRLRGTKAAKPKYVRTRQIGIILATYSRYCKDGIAQSNLDYGVIVVHYSKLLKQHHLDLENTQVETATD